MIVTGGLSVENVNPPESSAVILGDDPADEV